MTVADTITVVDVSTINETVAAYAAARRRVDELIERADEAGWTDRLFTLRNVRAKTDELALEIENLLR